MSSSVIVGREVLRAVAELGSAPAAPLASAQPPVTPAPLAAAPARPSVPVESAAERRHLTVMFCDLVGSTAISAQLDAEEWRDQRTIPSVRCGRRCRSSARLPN